MVHKMRKRRVVQHKVKSQGKDFNWTVNVKYLDDGEEVLALDKYKKSLPPAPAGKFSEIILIGPFDVVVDCSYKPDTACGDSDMRDIVSIHEDEKTESPRCQENIVKDDSGSDAIVPPDGVVDTIDGGDKNNKMQGAIEDAEIQVIESFHVHADIEPEMTKCRENIMREDCDGDAVIPTAGLIDNDLQDYRYEIEPNENSEMQDMVNVKESVLSRYQEGIVTEGDYGTDAAVSPNDVHGNGVEKENIVHDYEHLSSEVQDTCEISSSEDILYDEGHNMWSNRLCSYPADGSTRPVSVSREDYRCLEVGRFLNDTIIEFYIQYLKNSSRSAYQEVRFIKYLVSF